MGSKCEYKKRVNKHSHKINLKRLIIVSFAWRKYAGGASGAWLIFHRMTKSNDD